MASPLQPRHALQRKRLQAPLQLRSSPNKQNCRAPTAEGSGASPLSPCRRAKTSKFVGVKLRGKRSISIELRRPGHSERHTAANFESEKQAAMAHDLARRLLVENAAYLELREGKLNFWEERAFLAQCFTDYGLDNFVGKVWDKNMKEKLRDSALKALASMEMMIVDRGLQFDVPDDISLLENFVDFDSFE